MTETQDDLIRLSKWIDAHNAHRSEEFNMWSRTTKVTEEAGEVQKALRAYYGENPRKSEGLDDIVPVIEELLDTAVAALGAVEHILGHNGDSFELLESHIKYMARRANG